MGKDMGVDETGGLPPDFLSKMQLHWSKVGQAFRALDKDNVGYINRKNMGAICERFGCFLTNKELDQVLLRNA
jgi:Ca2+-binding EF-hand superfamily protein